MKIISKKEDMKECLCNFCNAQFYYTDNDIIKINENYYGFICPECGNEIEIERTTFKCSYPESFFHFGKGKILSNDEIQKFINKALMSLQKSNENDDYTLVASGDTIVFATKNSEDGISIYVAKNYYECDLI